MSQMKRRSSPAVDEVRDGELYDIVYGTAINMMMLYVFLFLWLKDFTSNNAESNIKNKYIFFV